MHGPGGEDEAIQGALELMRVPVTGSGLLGSALTMDKARSKWLLQRLGLPTAPFELLGPGDDPASALERFGLPVFVKPNCLGSSIGISKVTRFEELDEALDLAFQYGSEVLLEQAIDGKEYFAGILERTTLPLIGIETPRAFYDYEAKYHSSETRYSCPCGLDAGLEKALRAQSLEVFDALGASGWGRVDFILDEGGEPWFLEVNTVPGMTDHSLMPQAAARMGVDFDELVWRVLETSL
jgi:D-alanine-D-alanine ligase